MYLKAVLVLTTDEQAQLLRSVGRVVPQDQFLLAGKQRRGQCADHHEPEFLSQNNLETWIKEQVHPIDGVFSFLTAVWALPSLQ